MKLGYRKSFIDRESYIAQYLALAIFTIGVAIILEADDLLAAFAAGALYSLTLLNGSDSRFCRLYYFLGWKIHPDRGRCLCIGYRLHTF